MCNTPTSIISTEEGSTVIERVHTTVQTVTYQVKTCQRGLLWGWQDCDLPWIGGGMDIVGSDFTSCQAVKLSSRTQYVHACTYPLQVTGLQSTRQSGLQARCEQVEQHSRIRLPCLARPREGLCCSFHVRNAEGRWQNYGNK